MATDKKISELTAAASALSTDIIPVARSGANFSLTVAQVIAGSVPNSRQITTTSPLLGGGALTSNLSLTIQQASSTQSGYLSSGDWSLFNNKFNTPTGTISDYVRGDGSVAPFPTVTGFVPYTGANANVNLGEYSITTGQLNLDLSPTGTAIVGTTRWNNTNGITETTLLGGSVVLKNGIDLVARVVNNTSIQLTKAAYQVVKISGAQGQRLAVGLAQANNDNNSADTLGVVIETINNNQEGFIMTVGQLEEVNTTGSLQGETWADGDVLYLSPTTPGAVTKVKPNGSTGHIVVIGYVEYAHANHGKIYVKIMNGWELEELHDVYIPSYINNGTLYRDTTTNLWKTASIPTILGYTPEDSNNKSTNTSLGTSNILYPTQNAVKVYADNLLGNANALVYKGVIDCSANPNYPAANAGELYITSVAGKIGGASGIDVEVGDMIICNTDNSVSGNQATVGTNWNIIQKNIVGAVTGPASSINNNVAFFDGTTGKLIKDSGLTLSGVNTGDETQATIQTKLGLASTTTSGYLSSSNWNDFNNKIGGSGTFNYVGKFTSSGIIGNSSIQDNGTGISLGGATFGVNNSYKLRVPTNDAGQYGIFIEAQGNAKAGISSNTGGTNPAATTIAGEFIASGAGTKYAVKLTDGTEAPGKFLKSVDTDGKANWANISVSDVSGVQATITLTTTGTSGAATLVGNTLNIPQYSGGGAPVVGSADYLYLYNNFK